MFDPEACYRALRARDERFDGRFFVGVTSTGIYCRPVCPARPAKFEHCRFFPSAAAAHAAGFRPCLRCRPELAPQPGARRGTWRGSSGTVSRGLALISDGALDGDGEGVRALAERLGVGERQLRRLFRQHLGATPVAVAQARRVLFANQLIHDTRMPMGEIALASGYKSVRRFNESFRRLYRRAPSDLRRGAAARTAGAHETGVVVRLRYRPPYDWIAALAHLRARAIEGVESVVGETYVRVVRYQGEVGTMEVSHAPEACALDVAVRLSDVRALSAIVARARKMFDLGADVATIAAHLGRDAWLAPLVAARPGIRVLGAVDGFEAAARAVLGQQVSLGAARRLGAELVRLCGPPLPQHGTLGQGTPLLYRAFPSADDVLRADLSGLPMPGARKRSLLALSQAAAVDSFLFDAENTLEATVAKLTSIPGVGPWTAHMIALRACGEPDAFPAADLGIRRALASRAAGGMTAADVRARTDRWRPWRAYAAQHLWSAAHTSPAASETAR